MLTRIIFATVYLPQSHSKMPYLAGRRIDAQAAGARARPGNFGRDPPGKRRASNAGSPNFGVELKPEKGFFAINHQVHPEPARYVSEISESMGVL
jgi:hypothetical protein